MTSRATITEAELRRAVKVAQEAGLVAMIRGGSVHIVPAEDADIEYRKVAPTPPSERTALYRHFDAEGRLLYVGIARLLAARLAAHAKSGWDHLICRVDVEWFDDRASAEAAEIFAIKNERPIHNQTHNRRGG